MTSFINRVVTDLLDKSLQPIELSYVLPNKRAGLYLKMQLAEKLNKTFVVPEILTIEEFIENVSGLKYADNTELLFQFYKIYTTHTPSAEIDTFENVSSWANMLIQDFNNIDRYLIPPNDIFDYLNAITEINHWSLNEVNSQSITNYLAFWKRLKLYYRTFNEELSYKEKGYQGLVYKTAVTKIDEFLSTEPLTKYVFIGFNALNKAEEIILKQMLDSNRALVYWDADNEFINKSYHDAGLFLRAYKSSWSYYKRNKFALIGDDYAKPKEIEIISTPKNIGQVKYAGQLLARLKEKYGDLNSTALVLGDETLLLPLLNSLPKNLGPINVTMGIELASTPLASLFELLFGLHRKDSARMYYKEVVAILSHPSLRPVFSHSQYIEVSKFLNFINKNNLVYLTVEEINSEFAQLRPIVNLLFEPWTTIETALDKSINLIYSIRDSILKDNNQDVLLLEFLYRFHRLFNEILTLKNKYEGLKSIGSLYSIYRQLLKIETMDFKGEPLKGLQIMGMLETRVLDFKNVIMLSVNEGILPAGKNENSFIPYDVKKANQMPTYKEMDAVYTYHFYRLLQRAENAFLLYNSEPDSLNGGEKSRFISQLQFEGKHNLHYKTTAPKAPSIIKCPEIVVKTEAVMERLRIISNEGFSPSSLTNYVRNPIDFYYDKVLAIKENDIVEETVAANTIGSIIHNSIEKLYTPYLNEKLLEQHLTAMLTEIELTVKDFFLLEYKKGDISKGKNLIILEICKRYVANFIKKEVEQIRNGDSIIVLELEKKLRSEIDIPDLPFPTILKGTVDRIDTCNGKIRIIDYKTGKVSQGEVEIVSWEEITTDYKKFSKSFQLLCYAYLWNKHNPITEIEAGIISLKNLGGNQLLKFGTKPSTNSRTKNQIINSETLSHFEIELKNLIKEICNREIDFIEKDV